MTDEEEFYQALARDFVIQMRNQIVAAVDRLPDFDWDALHTLGNHLKGSGAMFGQPLLSELGRKLEREIEAGENSLAVETLHLLADVIRSL